MRSRILYELSRKLAILLEEGLRGGSGRGRIPVFLCHPLDPIEARPDLDSNAAGVLYPLHLGPEPRLRHGGLEWASPRGPGATERLQPQCQWLRVRYIFLVAGGSLELELEALAAACQTLGDVGEINLELEIEDGLREAVGPLPLRLVDAPNAWRDLGLEDHRLAVTFEVVVPLPTGRGEEVPRLLERALEIEGGGP